MVAAKGNKYATKLTTDELKRMAYDQYCAHLAKGKITRSWYFEHPDLTLCGKRMEDLIKQNPQDFPAIKKDVAFAKGLKVWESVCEDSANGENRKANTASLQMIMRNKFGWDKEEKKDEQTVNLEPKFTELMDALKGRQDQSSASKILPINSNKDN